MAKQFTDGEMAELLAKDSLLVIDFWAQWCGPCKKLAPIVEELADEYEGSVEIRKCDVEDNPESCEKFGIMNIPTIKFVKGGEVIDTHVGTIKKEDLKALIEKYK
ncbi:MAG: thioredoxin [Candidatus Limisoma sp.]|nr:thioredoxin [Candidatus Limisoma sp.]